MSSKLNRIIQINWPILHGTISKAMVKCGQKNCRCKIEPKALHGPYYRWTGRINNKITTKTLTKEIAEECERRIKNYNELQEKVELLLKEGSDSAPWIKSKNKKT